MSHLSQSFTIDGFVRHDALKCFKKWSDDYRDPTDTTPINSNEPQENTEPEDEALDDAARSADTGS